MLLAGVALGPFAAIGQDAPRPLPNEAKPARPVGSPPADGPSPREEPKPEPGEEIAIFEGRPIREVRLVKPVRPAADAPEGTQITFEPIDPETDKLVRNQLRLREGAAYEQSVVSADITRLNRIGRFKQVESRVQSFDDGTIALLYVLQLQPIVQDVQSVGNRRFSDQQINKEVDILRSTPVDPLQLERAARRIEAMYRKKGYYLCRVTTDLEEIEKTGIVLLKIREGERMKVMDIRFEGNRSFAGDEIRSVVKTKTAWLFERGPLDDDVLDDDVGNVIKFYKDRGHLDVRVDRIVRPAPNGKEAIVSFVIDEGPVYTLRDVETVYLEFSKGYPTIEQARAALRPGEKMIVLGPESLDGKDQNILVYREGQINSEQAKGLMLIKPGDVYSIDKLEKSSKILTNALGMMGYADARVERRERRDTETPVVDIVLFVFQGKDFKTGEVIIQGNDITQHKVARRQIEVKPDRPLDTVAIENSKNRLKNLNVFDNQRLRITTQRPTEDDPEHRDVLVEVAETNTGEFNVGAALSSDGGVVGRIAVTQRNFDVADTPDTFGELFSGRAFRGAGQTFTLQALPGDRVQSYAIGLSEPYLFESNYSGSAAFSYNKRVYDEYDEQRFGPRFALGRRLGTRWTATVPVRVERITLYNVPPESAVDIVNSAGTNNAIGVGLELTRSTFDNPVSPTNGTKLSLGVEQVLGSKSYNIFKLEHQIYIPIREDYLGRKTTLSFRTRTYYIPQDKDEIPVYDRFYLGGGDLRGFGYRTVSPRSVRADNGQPSNQPVGGTWLFAFTPEVKVPVFDELLAVVFFLDTGTVLNKPGLQDYRVSVGTGLRVNIPALSGAPLAFDFGIPLKKEPGDRTRLFTFSIDVPF
jgi:outer membrane protein insertion porin family